MNKSPLAYTRVSWNRMNSRCHNPNDPDYGRYGASGISVCPQWRDPKYGFAVFVQDMGLRPEGMTIDREDSKGNYEPGNCRWADSKTQNRHARTMLTYKGETRALGEWADIVGIKQTTLTMRLKKGMSVAEAFETPVAK